VRNKFRHVAGLSIVNAIKSSAAVSWCFQLAAQSEARRAMRAHTDRYVSTAHRCRRHDATVPRDMACTLQCCSEIMGEADCVHMHMRRVFFGPQS
jgi:hypothetical protein